MTKTEAPTSGVTDDGLKWVDVDAGGTTYRLRQTTVEEGDINWDAAYDEKKDRLNYRLNSRLNLVSAIVSPPTTIDDLSKWASVKLVALLREYDKLNRLQDADTEGN